MKTTRKTGLTALLCIGLGIGYATAQSPAAAESAAGEITVATATETAKETAVQTASGAAKGTPSENAERAGDGKKSRFTKAEERKQRKAEEQERNRKAFTLARQALAAREFVLEVDQARFKQRTPVRVSSSKNFISVQGDNGVVQIAFDLLSGGPNGMGGVTFTGRVSNYRLETDKRGNLSLTMDILGKGISSRVMIGLKKDRPDATAEVIPNFNSHLFSVTGTLKPYGEATVFQGREL